MRIDEIQMPNKIDGKPTQNSLGRPIHHTVDGVKNFWRWFGDSKVVDAQSRPLVLYHGTDDAFGEFDIQKTKSVSRFGPGFYFSADKKTLDAYSTNGSIMPVYLKISNPMTDNTMTASQVETFFNALQDKVFPNGFDATEHHEEAKQEALNNLDFAFEILRRTQVNLISKDDWFRGLQAIGVDGVIQKVFGSLEFVVYSPSQIKSATDNKGTFSPHANRITENEDI